MTLTPEILLAYADGLLDDTQAHEVAVLLEQDADARETLRLMRLSAEALARARAGLARDAAVTPASDPIASFVLSDTDETRPHAAIDRVLAGLSPWRMAAAVALLAVGVGTGIFVSSTVLAPSDPNANVASWVMSVVEYQSLFARSTVEAAWTSDEERAALEAQISEAMRRGVHIAIPDLSEAGLEFRRGQVLDYDGWPLVQLEYLPRDGGKPVAVCFKRFGEGRSPREFLTIDGIEVLRWARDGMEFLIVGEAEQDALTRAADTTNAQVFKDL